MDEINQTPLLSAREEKKLARRIRAGDAAARDRMIRANLRLVVRIARSYREPGVSLDDLIEEGNLGLIRAVERFDPARNTRFSTYGSYWIREAITRHLDSVRALPLPSYVVQMLREWRRESNALEKDIGRRPSDEEINGRMKLSPRKLHIVNRALNVLASRRTGTTDVELDLDEMLASQPNGHENHVATKELLGKALHLLDVMNGREAKVVRWHFGLLGTEPMSLEQIGKRLGLTRERVRQIESEALLKLHEKMLSPTRD